MVHSLWVQFPPQKRGVQLIYGCWVGFPLEKRLLAMKKRLGGRRDIAWEEGDTMAASVLSSWPPRRGRRSGISGSHMMVRLLLSSDVSAASETFFHRQKLLFEWKSHPASVNESYSGFMWRELRLEAGNHRGTENVTWILLSWS